MTQRRPDPEWCEHHDAPSSSTTPIIATIGSAEIFAPLPTREWVCERLRIAGGGRVTLIVGPPAGGKTINAQTLAVAVATGRKWLGSHCVQRTRVLHLDREVGHWLTCSRYQRIARAMGVTADDIGDRLRVAIYPSLTLDRPDAEGVLTATCREYGLVIIDSLAAYSGDAEEHTPAVGQLLLMLGRVSGATGAAIVVLHHTRRDGEMRGSTSIPGGAECTWRMVDVDRGRSRLVHERSPMGDPQPDIIAQIADVAMGDDPRAGLTVRELDEDDIAAEKQTTRDARAEADADTIRSLLRARPGIGTRELRDACGWGGPRHRAALMALGSDLRVEEEIVGRTRTSRHYLEGES